MTKVYVCSPSSAVRRAAEVHRGVRRLQAMGLTVELDASALARDSRFAGSDTQRLEALQRAAASGADVVLTTRGGYGLSRLLPRLPYAAMARSIARGTQWVGFSDFTALQLALLAKRGAVTWQGPALIEDFGQTEAPHALTLACWGDALAGVGEGVGWRVPAAQAANRSWQPLTLWGGNLSMVASLVGTPYLPNVARGALFLEDVGEAPYRVERMLSQLAHAGVLQKQKLILLGACHRFSGYKPIAAPRCSRAYRLDTVGPRSCYRLAPACRCAKKGVRCCCTGARYRAPKAAPRVGWRWPTKAP
jgi:muramoyltetrapeptide carboxypeptidase